MSEINKILYHKQIQPNIVKLTHIVNFIWMTPFFQGKVCFHSFFFFFLVFRDRVSLCSPGYPGTHSVDQIGLELRNPPASASRVLGLKTCTAMPGSFLFVCLFGFFLFLFFRDRVSLYSPGCPRTHFVDQAGLELRNPPASASRVLGLKACATTPGSFLF
jgi:hypothetical protein